MVFFTYVNTECTLDGHGVKGHLMPSSYPEPSLITLDKKI